MVSETPSVLQTLLARLEAPAPAVRPATAGVAEPASATTTSAGPKVTIPDGAVSLDPNARRGTYLNIVV